MDPRDVAVASLEAMGYCSRPREAYLRIRCERCATVYELDEKRLPARGALVKCTRCQHVFRATPPPEAAPPEVRSGENAAAAPPDPAPRPGPSEDRTAVFDFSRNASPEQTASFAAAPPPPAHRAAQEPSRPRVAAAPPRATRKAPARWPWVLLVAVLLAAALAAFWFGSRRSPAGAGAAATGVEALDERLAENAGGYLPGREPRS